MSLIKRLQDPYYQGAAAEMGFYFIFSIVPIITILTQILGYAGVTGIFSELLDTAFANNSFISSFLRSFENTLSGGINFVFIIGALWASSKIEFSLIRISNYTYKIDNGNQITGIRELHHRAAVRDAKRISEHRFSHRQGLYAAALADYFCHIFPVYCSELLDPPQP